MIISDDSDLSSSEGFESDSNEDRSLIVQTDEDPSSDAHSKKNEQSCSVVFYPAR